MTDVPPTTPPLKKVTRKQAVFVEYYVTLWNATEAARRAKFAFANVAASKLMDLPQIKAAIAERMKAISMPADEVLTRLTEQGRVNINDFITHQVETRYTKAGNAVQVEVVGINWEAVKDKGYLVKKISWAKAGNPIIELHDGQVALVQIGKALGLFSADVDVNINLIKGYASISPDDWDDPAP